MKKNFTRTLYRLQARLSHRVNWRWLNNWKTLTGISLLTAGGMAACRGETSKRTSATFIVPEENVINDDTDAQITTDTLSRDDVFCYVTEDFPEFPEGDVASYIRKHLIYPKGALENEVTGKVFVQFVIDTTGQVTNVKVLRPVHPLLDEEAMRVVREMPRWKPGRQRGKACRVSYTVPIAFTEEMMMETIEADMPLCYDVEVTFPPMEKLNKSIQDSIHYPEEAVKLGISGIVHVSVTIQPDGSLANAHVVRKVHPLLDAEALRVVGTLTNWKPALIEGTSVPETLVVSVPFKLKNQAEDKVYQVVEDMPKFLEGDIIKYVNEHLRYPEEAKEQGIEGKVFVQFIIERNGYIVEVKVLRPVHPLLDEEAMRVVREMPRWKPGAQNGKPVRVSYVLPVEFRLGK